MGYGRFMGYAMHFPANQLGGHKMLWDKRGSTVDHSEKKTEVAQ